ncbi:MAG: glycogen/starch synthase, partial [Alistipes sp.]|nr:glycogen/starch synthase [Alistipes sp.]
VVHCHGWFSAMVPIYLKKVFHDDPIFKDVKIVVSLYDDRFEKPLHNLRKKVAGEGVQDKNLSILDDASYENLYRFVIGYADGVVLASEGVDAAVVEFARQSGKPILEYQSPDAEGYYDNYNRFYEEIR